jgi:drug/metabolite transporter (DMT)-like permease
MLLASVVLTALALVFLKTVAVDSRGEIFKILSSAKFYLAMFIYGIAFLMWIISASKIDYTVMIFSNTAGLVLGGLVGYFVFNESITGDKILAYLLIISGVVVLFNSSITS